jgi:urease accessory protein
MLRATAVVRHLAVKADRVADTIVLDHEGRHRRRVVLKALKGTEFLLDLEKATVVKGGDAFKLEDGRLVQVMAAPQKLLEVRAETPTRLAKLAWHIGNRHTPAEITGEAIYIETDHVLAEMVRGLGGSATELMRPFEPERGAYDGGHGHGHSHGHGHDDGHGHATGHVHSDDHERDHGHDHGHDHHHDHGHHGHTHAHGTAAGKVTARDVIALDHDHDHAGHGCGCGHDHSVHDHHGHDHGDHGHDRSHSHSHAHGHGHAPAMEPAVKSTTRSDGGD